MPSVSATICARIVRVPWPISVRRRGCSTPVAASSSAGARRELDLAAAGEARTVEEERQADAAPRPRPAHAGVRGSWRAHRLCRTSRAPQSSPSRWPVAVVSPGRNALRSRTATGSSPSASAMRSRCDLDGELGLRRAEAAERTVGRRVGHDDAAVDPDVVAAVRTVGVDHAARQHDRDSVHVGTAVEEHVDVHRGQAPIRRDARAMSHDRRVALRGRRHVLDAVVDHLHGPPDLRARSAAWPAMIDG